MKSKDVLKNIKNLSYCKQNITIQEWCNIIEQDLEILEILKEQSHNFNHILYRNIEEKDKWQKVEEWLYRE